LIASPINIVLESRELWYLFSAWQWSIVQDRVETGLLITMAVEMLCNTAMLVMALFLTVMFFTRRHTFPRFFIGFFVFSLAVDGGDALVLQLLSYPGVEVAASDIGALIRRAIAAAIWSLYFMKSKRVQATFTRRRKHAAPPQGDEDAERHVILQNAG
jgi:hypothetical protein